MPWRAGSSEGFGSTRKQSRRDVMKINIDNNLVEFTPKSEDETKALEALWKVVVDCVKFNKKLVAVGEFVPGQNSTARFAIED
jgi:hypothetical protein